MLRSRKALFLSKLKQAVGYIILFTLFAQVKRELEIRTRVKRKKPLDK